jgi:hypothetical protein
MDRGLSLHRRLRLRRVLCRGRLRRRSGLSVAANEADAQGDGEADLQTGTARVRHTFNLAAERWPDEVAKYEGTA